jgi:hypothetical protein
MAEQHYPFRLICAVSYVPGFKCAVRLEYLNSPFFLGLCIWSVGADRVSENRKGDVYKNVPWPQIWSRLDEKIAHSLDGWSR